MPEENHFIPRTGRVSPLVTLNLGEIAFLATYENSLVQVYNDEWMFADHIKLYVGTMLYTRVFRDDLLMQFVPRLIESGYPRRVDVYPNDEDLGAYLRHVGENVPDDLSGL